MWNSFKAVFLKEWLHIRRSRTVLVLAFALPLFQLIMYGFLDQTVHDVATVVVDQDRSPQSRLLIDRLRATKTFRINRITGNPHEAREDIIAARARVGIVIPSDFQNKRARNTGAQVLVLIDGSDSAVSAQALAAVNGLVAQANLEEIKGRAPQVAIPMSAQPIILFNPAGKTANFIMPGLVAILLQLVAIVLAAVTIVTEREFGTLEQLLVTPINVLGLMLGKLGPYLFVGLGETVLILFVMRYGFDVPIRGNLLFLFGMILIYLFALLALGLFISTRTTTQLAAQQMGNLFLLPSIFLSGYIFPREGLPWFLYYLGSMLPATHMIAIMRGIVLRDAGFMELVPNVLALLAISAVLISMSVRSLRKITT